MKRQPSFTRRFACAFLSFAMLGLAACAAELADDDLESENASALTACPAADAVTVDDTRGAGGGVGIASLRPMADPAPIPPADQRKHQDPRRKHVGAKDPKKASGTPAKPVGQYNPGYNYLDKNKKLPDLEDAAIDNGKEVKCGAKKNTRYFEYQNPGGVVGYSGGVETDWIRVEITGNVVHSYPIPKPN